MCMKALQASFAVHAAAQRSPLFGSLSVLDMIEESAGWVEHLAWYPLIHLSLSPTRQSLNVLPSRGVQSGTTKQFVDGVLVGAEIGVTRLELDGESKVDVALVGEDVEETTEDDCTSTDEVGISTEDDCTGVADGCTWTDDDCTSTDDDALSAVGYESKEELETETTGVETTTGVEALGVTLSSMLESEQVEETGGGGGGGVEVEVGFFSKVHDVVVTAVVRAEMLNGAIRAAKITEDRIVSGLGTSTSSWEAAGKITM
jgi:hypothetical protein